MDNVVEFPDSLRSLTVYEDIYISSCIPYSLYNNLETLKVVGVFSGIPLGKFRKLKKLKLKTFRYNPPVDFSFLSHISSNPKKIKFITTYSPDGSTPAITNVPDQFEDIICYKHYVYY